MPVIEIDISNKIARLFNNRDFAVCGNSDYKIHFEFDSEWNEYDIKTARFKYNGEYTDVVFSGDVCTMPVISNARTLEIGVYAGDLHTTSPALLPMKKSILCGDDPKHPEPEADVYNQLIEMIKTMNAGGAVNGIPTGGTAGQILTKKSDDDFDVEWADFEIPNDYGKITYNQDRTIIVS